jgi:hypothetical protein
VSQPIIPVAPIHFEDFDGRTFERLVFAYLLRTDNWRTLDWFGQVGKDKGRDICGERLTDGRPQGEKVCVLCANWRKLTAAKVKGDLKKLKASNWANPDQCIVLSGGSVSAKLRDGIKKLVAAEGIANGDVWSGAEFEERLRHKAESLLQRFVNGEKFPDAPDQIKLFIEGVGAANDDEILALMAGVFDRPAFYTPFHDESSIPAFKQALTDTIQALGTGIHKARDGTIIRRIPSWHDIKARNVRDAVAQIERKVASLRAQFDAFVRSDDIKLCGCNDPNCPVFTPSEAAKEKMDQMRSDILESFRKLHPDFAVRVGM